MTEFYKAVAQGNINDEDDAFNVFTFSSNETDASAVMSATKEWFDLMFTGLLTALSTKYKIVGILLYVLVGEVWTLVGERAVTDLNGGASSDMTPNQVAAVVTAPTGVKKKVGKKFIAGISEGNQSQGVLASDFLTLLVSFAASWISAFTASNGVSIDPLIISEKTGHAASPPTGARVDTVVGSQRRRKQGTGK